MPGAIRASLNVSYIDCKLLPEALQTGLTAVLNERTIFLSTA